MHTLYVDIVQSPCELRKIQKVRSQGIIKIFNVTSTSRPPDSPSGFSLSTAWMSIRPGRLARTVMVLAPEFLSARWMLRLCQSVQ